MSCYSQPCSVNIAGIHQYIVQSGCCAARATTHGNMVIAAHSTATPITLKVCAGANIICESAESSNPTIYNCDVFAGDFIAICQQTSSQTLVDLDFYKDPDDTTWVLLIMGMTCLFAVVIWLLTRRPTQEITLEETTTGQTSQD